MNTRTKNIVLIPNARNVASVFQTAGRAPSTTPGAMMRMSSNVKNGMSQPPKNRVAISAEAVSRFEYSAMKNIENFMEEYSVLYPVTSSDSASAMSKGR